VSISIQTLQDAIIAVITTVGIAVAISVAIALAGAFSERATARDRHAAREVAPVQHATQTDDARELVLR
jgi:MFS superfamily sulfate permease-like transporter